MAGKNNQPPKKAAIIVDKDNEAEAPVAEAPVAEETAPKAVETKEEVAEEKKPIIVDKKEVAEVRVRFIKDYTYNIGTKKFVNKKSDVAFVPLHLANNFAKRGIAHLTQ